MPDAVAFWFECAAKRAMTVDPRSQVQLIIELVENGASREPSIRLLAELSKRADKRDSAAALGSIAEAQAALGDRDGSLRSADRAIRHVESSSELWRWAAYEGAIRAYAAAGQQGTVDSLISSKPEYTATAAAAYALAGRDDRARALLAAAAPPTSLAGKLDLARAWAALGDTAAFDAVLRDRLLPNERSLALLRVSEDALARGHKDIGQWLERAQKQSHQLGNEKEKIAQWLSLARLWLRAGNGDRAKALLGDIERGAESLDSMYRGAYLGRLAQILAAAGDTRGAIKVAERIRDTSLARMGPYPIALIHVLTRRGDYKGALDVLSDNSIAPDGYALALIALRYLGSGDKDAAFEKDLTAAAEAFCPRPKRPAHIAP